MGGIAERLFRKRPLPPWNRSHDWLKSLKVSNCRSYSRVRLDELEIFLSKLHRINLDVGITEMWFFW